MPVFLHFCGAQLYFWYSRFIMVPEVTKSGLTSAGGAATFGAGRSGAASPSPFIPLSSSSPNERGLDDFDFQNLLHFLRRLHIS